MLRNRVFEQPNFLSNKNFGGDAVQFFFLICFFFASGGLFLTNADAFCLVSCSIWCMHAANTLQYWLQNWWENGIILVGTGDIEVVYIEAMLRKPRNVKGQFAIHSGLKGGKLWQGYFGPWKPRSKSDKQIQRQDVHWAQGHQKTNFINKLNKLGGWATHLKHIVILVKLIMSTSRWNH